MGEIITDAIGTWEKVGQVLSAYDTWVSFGEYHSVVSGQYRVKFISDRIDLVKSFAWLRVQYLGNLVSPGIRIYPKVEALRVYFPIPEEYRSVGINIQQFQIYKRFRNKQSIDRIWSLSIEQLIITEKESQNTVTLVLDNPIYSRDPVNPNLWVSVFTQVVTDKRGLALPQFEIGRFYKIADNSVFSDPIILSSSNGQLTVAFTSNEIIQPSTLYVRIIY